MEIEKDNPSDTEELAVNLGRLEETISHLRKKIEDNPKTPRYIITVWGTGYKFQEA